MSDRKVGSVSRAELERRWALIRNHMVDHKLDAVISVGSSGNLAGTMRWFIDTPASYRRVVIFWPSEPMTIVEHGQAGTIRTLDGNDADRPGIGEVYSTSTIPTINYTQDYEAKITTDILKRRGVRKVGLVVPDAMPYGFINTLKNNLEGQVTFTDETDFVDMCKAIKSPEEIALLQKAAEMQDQVFSVLLEKIHPGMRDFEIGALMQYEGRLRGGQTGSLSAGSAPLGKPAHFMPEARQGGTLGKGEHVGILIENAGQGGYFQELARTIVLGRATNELLDTFGQMKEAQHYTASLCKPGAKCSDVGAAFNAYMVERKLPPEKRLFAHGHGYDLVERPLIREDETMTIEKNMCFAIHPGVQNQSLFAVCCDNYLVDNTGTAVRLHKTEQKVFEVA